jgi:hypothetical protein
MPFSKQNFPEVWPHFSLRRKALWLFFRDGCPLVVKMSSNAWEEEVYKLISLQRLTWGSKYRIT